MVSLNIVVLGENPEARSGFAHLIGKTGSADDLGFYHTVFQGKIVTAVDPVSYPSKLSCMLQALRLADHAVVIADAPTPTLGELVVSLDLLGMDTVFLSPLDLAPILTSTSLKNSRIFDSPQEAKNHFLGLESAKVAGSPLVLVDHCFEVRGVGTVALGIVARGSIHVHDTLEAMPLGREVEIKSIQTNDVDVKEAFGGDRVGLCLKGLKASEVGRGTVFASAGSIQASKDFECLVSPVKFSKTPLASGAYHVSAGLQFEPCRLECATPITPGEQATVEIHCEKPIAFEPGEKTLLCNLNANGLRVLASVKIAKTVQNKIL